MGAERPERLEPWKQEGSRPLEALPRAGTRSVAQLDMLHSLAPRLNRLNDVEQIGEAITAELETIIDYHNCRVYLLQPDGKTLLPVAFRGRLGEYEDETFDELVTEVGEGVTGLAAQTGESMLIANALYDPRAVSIEGTDDIDESMLVVPLKYDERVTGVIVLASLGVGLFDEEDLRLLEVLGAHAAVAFENARLFQLEREAAETASALLELSQSLTAVHEIEAVLRATIPAVSGIIPCAAIAAYVRDPQTRAYRQVAQQGIEPSRLATMRTEVEPEIAEPLILSAERPFVLTRDVIARMPSDYRLTPDVHETLVAPLRWEPDGFAALIIVKPGGDESFDGGDLRLARGIAQITALALGNARRFDELARFHDLVEGLDAVFWECDPATLRFSFVSSKAAELLGLAPGGAETDRRAWGDHVDPRDRERVLVQLNEAVRQGVGTTAEYRRLESGDRPVWIRDLVSTVRDPAGGDVAMLRGLMVDITERKLAEEALQVSERKFSEAFEREREASGRLRALDEMKNTFLEAVSHELRTPLTSILGSSITLQNERDLPREDALDLVQRIAANARKLERLLGDLLDVDRLQRGIVVPQRRPTDVGEIVRLACEQTELLGDRTVELDAEPFLANVDAAKVERIVENLLVNATKHTPPDATLWIRVRPEDGGVLLVVEDDGPGIPEDQVEAIFEPFRQLPGASDHSPGVGIGLSLVARFAELHGGRAWVEERPGGGASFHVVLPAG